MKPVSDLNSNLKVRDFQLPGTGAPKPGVTPQGPSFKETLTQLQNPSVRPQASAQTQGLKFSNHALERLRSRGIAFGADEMQRLEAGVEKAAKKGSRDSLVLMGDSAFVVSVNNKTVVTVMDKNMMKDNVFTNIDSTVVL